jgi:hypothetical protein
MANTLRVWFSGLCHFVDNKDPNDGSTCVVLVKDQEHKAGIYTLDWSKKKQNRGRPLGTQIIPLDGHYVTFETSDVSKEAQSVPLRFDDYGRVEMEDLVEDFADGDTDIANYEPSPETQKKIVGQVFLKGDRRGSVKDQAVVDTWEIPDTVNEEFRRSMEVADPVFIEKGSVAEVFLVVREFGGKVVLRERLGADSNGNFEIIVTNNCKEGHRYFEWIVGAHEVKLIQVDRDFEHHYNMLNPKARAAMNKLERISKGAAEYPVPERTLFLLSNMREIPAGWKDLEGPFSVPSPEYKTLAHFFFQMLLSLAPAIAKSLGTKTFALRQRRFRRLKHAFLLFFHKYGTRGSGVGSGCDCLPCGGKPQFFEIPSSPARPSEKSPS